MASRDHGNAMPGTADVNAGLVDLTDTIKTLQNGVRGYETAAEEVDDQATAGLLRELALSRKAVLEDLVRVTAAEGGDVPDDASGTIPGVIHRGWMQIKSAVAGDEGIIDSALTGEAEATSDLEQALEAGPDAPVEAIIRRALLDVERAKERLEQLKTG